MCLTASGENHEIKGGQQDDPKNSISVRVPFLGNIIASLSNFFFFKEKKRCHSLLSQVHQRGVN